MIDCNKTAHTGSDTSFITGITKNNADELKMAHNYAYHDFQVSHFRHWGGCSMHFMW